MTTHTETERELSAIEWQKVAELRYHGARCPFDTVTVKWQESAAEASAKVRELLNINE